MTAITVGVDLADLDRQLRAFERRLAQRSGRALAQVQARALNRAMALATTRVRRRLASAKRIPQRVIQRRISGFKARADKLAARVWIGTKRKIPIASIDGARTVLAGRKAGVLKAGRIEVRPFRARLPSGRVAQFVRVEPGQRRTAGRPLSSSPNLPIEEPAIRLMPEAAPILEEEARAAMRGVYVNELRRLLVRALKA